MGLSIFLSNIELCSKEKNRKEVQREKTFVKNGNVCQNSWTLKICTNFRSKFSVTLTPFLGGSFNRRASYHFKEYDTRNWRAFEFFQGTLQLVGDV